MSSIDRRLADYDSKDLDKPVKHPLFHKRVRALEGLIKKAYAALELFPEDDEMEVSEIGQPWTVNQVPLYKSLIQLFAGLCAARGTALDYYNLAALKVTLAGYYPDIERAKPLYEDVVKLLDDPVFIQKDDPDVYTLLAEANYHLGIFTRKGADRLSYLELAYHNAFQVIDLRCRLTTGQCHYFGRIHIDYATSGTKLTYEFREFLYERGIELLAKSLKRTDSIDDHRELGYAYFYAAAFYRSAVERVNAAKHSQILLTEAVNLGEDDVRVIEAISILAQTLHK